MRFAIMFLDRFFSAITSEATPIGTTLARVRASDRDHKENAAITYRFIKGNERGTILCF